MAEQITWQQIAEKHGTDKASHGYMPHYGKHLPNNPKRILEIGCLAGASLRMWREIYPDAEIHCLDLFEEHPQPTDIPGVIYWKGNQTDQYILEQIRRLDFDVIIEDGSHNSRDQLITFWSLWGCCKIYVVEDLHCAFDEPYRQGLPFNCSMLSQLQDAQHLELQSLKWVWIYDNKIAFIYAD